MSTVSTDYKSLCQKLYDPKDCGVVVVKRALSPILAISIRHELEENRRNYVPRPKHYGTTMQGLSSWDFERAILRNYKYLAVLDSHYSAFSDRLHEHMGPCQKVDEISVNSSFYKVGSLGIGPHRDNSFSINFVAIYIISGSNEFCTARDKSKNEEIQFETVPGDLVLMRAPRNPAENDLRPIHYVGEIKSDRYIVVFRNINHELLHQTDRHRQYNA
ncbi:MAG: hypothetical protein AAB392_03330 [Patescibacteria group bacterium]